MIDKIAQWNNETFEMLIWNTSKKYTYPLKSFTPFPTYSDENAYASLSNNLKQQIIKEGEAFLNYSYPVLMATDYMAFLRTGNRVNFETKYFARRDALCSLVIAECVERKGRFIDDIINGIFCICEESGWQLPPHNSYLRDQPQLLLPDSDKPVIDLFACETGALLSCIYYVLGSLLDQYEPCIKKKIHCEIEKRIIVPYLNEHFWWMGSGYEKMCNWTPWCTQNILITALLVDFSSEIQRKVFDQAAASCDYFLKDYEEDGCCDEGAQYFRHAGLCLGVALNIMNCVSDNTFAEIFSLRKIQNMFSFILNMHVDDKYYVNFADCCAVAGRCTVQDYLLGKWANLPSLMNFAASDYKAGGCKLHTDEVYRISLYYRLQTIFNYEEIINYKATADVEYSDLYYKGVGLFIARSTDVCLAVKAGCNDDSHNHNDVGSITIYKKGRPLLVDIGVESYTAKTFSNRRYEIWTMQSGYHNLPTINGKDELAGTQYRASNITYVLDTTHPYIEMNIEGAFPSEAFTLTEQKGYYHRKVSLNKKDQYITIEDTTNCNDVMLNFISYYEPLVLGNTINIGDLASMKITGGTYVTTEVLPITDERLQQAWDHYLYRIRIRMENGNTNISLS